LQAPLGHCYWAVAPFAPAPPFQIYQEGGPPGEVPSVEPFRKAVRKGVSEFRLLIPVKIRPVLVISPVLPEHDEVLALRLRRFEKLSSDNARQEVRDGGDPSLFHLRPDRFAGLPTENAAIVSALLRLPTTALDRSASLGALDENELRVLHERVARAHHFRLDLLVLQRAQELVKRAQGS
jgi:hypothetical protein